jgi:hypothetical protein
LRAAALTPPQTCSGRRSPLRGQRTDRNGSFAAGRAQLAERKLSARSELAQALRYIIKRHTALTRFSTEARLEADNDIAENAIRSIALGRRNWLFAGSHSGGQRAAAMYSILQTAKLNGINPEAYLTDIFSRIAAGHPITRIRTDALGLSVSAARPCCLIRAKTGRLRDDDRLACRFRRSRPLIPR